MVIPIARSSSFGAAVRNARGARKPLSNKLAGTTNTGPTRRFGEPILEAHDEAWLKPGTTSESRGPAQHRPLRLREARPKPATTGHTDAAAAGGRALRRVAAGCTPNTPTIGFTRSAKSP